MISRPRQIPPNPPGDQTMPVGQSSVCSESNRGLQWIAGFNTAPAKSACGSYVIKLLASPEGHYGAFHRPSLYDQIPCGNAVATLAEAKAQAEAHLEKLKALAVPV